MSPLQEFHILSRALRANPFLWGVWLCFRAHEIPGQPVWKPQASDCSSLSFAHPSFSCFAFPCLLDYEWIRKLLWSTCFLSIPINIWVFLINNMGYETNTVNIKKMIPSAARPGNSRLHANPLNSTSSISPNLCLLCMVWPLCLGKQGDDVGHALPWAPGRNNSICSVPIPKQASPRSDYLISCRGEKIVFCLCA